MTTTDPPRPPPDPVLVPRPTSAEPEGRQPASAPAPALAPAPAPSPSSAAQGRPPTVLFAIAFASSMSDCDVALLARTLDMTTQMYPKMRPSPNGLGVARLDHYSGLFLARGAAEGQWVLEARTWDQPAPRCVHEWLVVAAGAARLLDPSVGTPERLAGVSPECPTYPPGRAANKRLARMRRRIV